MVKLELEFPKLTGTSYYITSIATPEYNCIAWAAGDNSKWWWPDPYDLYYWPPGVFRKSTIEAFAEAVESLGYEIGQDSGLEKDLEKVAIFAHPDGSPTHAARQLDDGTWTSKLGSWEDIRHVSLQHVGGRTYGNPVLVLQRPRTLVESASESV